MFNRRTSTQPPATEQNSWPMPPASTTDVPPAYTTVPPQQQPTMQQQWPQPPPSQQQQQLPARPPPPQSQQPHQQQQQQQQQPERKSSFGRWASSFKNLVVGTVAPSKLAHGCVFTVNNKRRYFELKNGQLRIHPTEVPMPDDVEPLSPPASSTASSSSSSASSSSSSASSSSEKKTAFQKQVFMVAVEFCTVSRENDGQRRHRAGLRDNDLLIDIDPEAVNKDISSFNSFGLGWWGGGQMLMGRAGRHSGNSAQNLKPHRMTLVADDKQDMIDWRGALSTTSNARRRGLYVKHEISDSMRALRGNGRPQNR